MPLGYSAKTQLLKVLLPRCRLLGCFLPVESVCPSEFEVFCLHSLQSYSEHSPRCIPRGLRITCWLRGSSEPLSFPWIRVDVLTFCSASPPWFFRLCSSYGKVPYLVDNRRVVVGPEQTREVMLCSTRHSSISPAHSLLVRVTWFQLQGSALATLSSHVQAPFCPLIFSVWRPLFSRKAFYFVPCFLVLPSSLSEYV